MNVEQKNWEDADLETTEYFSRYWASLELKDGSKLFVWIRISEGSFLGEGVIDIPLTSGRRVESELADCNRQLLGELITPREVVEKVLEIPWGTDGELVGSSYFGRNMKGNYVEAFVRAGFKLTEDQLDQYYGKPRRFLSNSDKVIALAEMFEERTGMKLKPLSTDDLVDLSLR